MAVESAEDLAGMLADWDVAVIGGTEVNGIFADGYIEVLGMEAEGPTFLCAASDVAGVSRGTAVTIGAEAYTVVSVQRDGTALAQIKLQAA